MDPTWRVRMDAPGAGAGPRLAVKDCIDVAGLPTTVGCQVIAEQAPPAAQDAPAGVAGRIRPQADPAVDAAVDSALAAAGVRTQDVTGLDFAATAEATRVLLDAEAYQVNAYLMPHLDRLSRRIRLNLTEAATITADQVAAAQRMRQAVRDWFAGLLARHPFLVMPTLTGAPPLLGEHPRLSLTVLTMPANLAGLPALALPVPGGPDGLPASLQLIGPPNGEEQLIAIARTIEAAIAARRVP